MAATGIAVFVGPTPIGEPPVQALAIVAGPLDFNPLVGPFLGALPAVPVAQTAGVESLAWTIRFFVCQRIEGNVMAPPVMRYAMSIAPAVTLFAMILVGGPLTVAARLLVMKSWVEPHENATPPGTA